MCIRDSANVNTDIAIRLWQDLIFKFAQARHEVTPSTIFGNGNSAWFAWQLSRPTNIKWFFAFGYIDFTISIFKSTLGKFSRLPMSFLFECWVLSTTLKEVLKSRLLMSDALLQSNTRNIIQKSKFRLFFKFSEFSTCLLYTSPSPRD